MQESYKAKMNFEKTFIFLRWKNYQLKKQTSNISWFTFIEKTLESRLYSIWIIVIKCRYLNLSRWLQCVSYRAVAFIAVAHEDQRGKSFEGRRSVA